MIASSESIKDTYIDISNNWTYEDIRLAMDALSDMGIVQQIYMSDRYKD